MMLAMVGIVLLELPLGAQPSADAKLENPLPTILRDWQQRRERASVVRFELVGTRTWPKGSCDFDPVDPIAPENPEHDVTGTFERMVLLDLVRNRFRVEFDNQDYDNLSRKVYRVRCVEMGDGVALRVRILENSGTPVRKNSAKGHVDFWIARGDPQLMPPGIFESSYEPLFYAAGIVPTKDVRVRPTALIPTNDPGDFTFVAERIEGGRRYAVIREKKGAAALDERGRRPLWLEVQKEYWVDLERDSAIVKAVSDGLGWRTTTDIKYQQTPGGWLPREWTRESTFEGKPRRSDRVEVKTTAVFPAIADQDFTFEPTPGMYVEDEMYSRNPNDAQLTGNSKYYRLETDGRRTELNEYLYPLGETNAPAVSK